MNLEDFVLEVIIKVKTQLFMATDLKSSEAKNIETEIR